MFFNIFYIKKKIKVNEELIDDRFWLWWILLVVCKSCFFVFNYIFIKIV